MNIRSAFAARVLRSPSLRAINLIPWLSGSVEEAFKLARSYAADQMRLFNQGQSARICWGRPEQYRQSHAQAPC